MASPQKEKGFTPIANELLDALARTRIPGEARQLLDVIIRQTYGWHRKSVQIAYAWFVAFTGVRRGHIHRALKTLIDHGMIILTEDGYAVQKNYDLWKPFARSAGLSDTNYGASAGTKKGVGDAAYPSDYQSVTGT